MTHVLDDHGEPIGQVHGARFVLPIQRTSESSPGLSGRHGPMDFQFFADRSVNPRRLERVAEVPPEAHRIKSIAGRG